MSDRIDLPTGGWVQLRDPNTLRRKDERAARSRVTDHTKAALVVEDLEEGVIAVMVIGWEIPYLPNAPLPSEQISILGELELPDYRVINEASKPGYQRLFPPKVDLADAGDHESPYAARQRLKVRLAGGVPIPTVTLEDELLAEAAVYDWFGMRYGWDPERVDNLPAHLYHRLPTVAAVRDEVRAEARAR